MPAVQEITWTPDGVAGIFIKELVSGEETGPFLNFKGGQSISANKEVSQRTKLADNIVYIDESKFQKFTITLTLAGVRPDMMRFCAPGSLEVISPQKAIFHETSTGQPDRFNLYVFQDATDPDTEIAVAPKVYKNCLVQNIQNDGTSGELGDIVLTITGLSDSNNVIRDWVFDMDLVGFDTDSSDVTPPTVADVDASSGTFPGAVAVGANILIEFSEEMKAASLVTANVKIRKVSDSSVVTAVNTYTPGTPFQLSINPTVDLAAATVYSLQVRALVQDEAGNYMADEYTTLFTTA